MMSETLNLFHLFQNNRVFFVFIFTSAQFQIKCSTMSEYNQAHCSAGSRPWEKGGGGEGGGHPDPEIRGREPRSPKFFFGLSDLSLG